MEKLVMFVVLIFEVVVESIRSMKKAAKAFGRGVKKVVMEFRYNWEEILQYTVWLAAVMFGIVFGAVAFAYVIAEVMKRMTSDLREMLAIFIPEGAAGGIATFIIFIFILILVWIFCFCILHKKAFRIYMGSKGKYSFSKALELEKNGDEISKKPEEPTSEQSR